MQREEKKRNTKETAPDKQATSTCPDVEGAVMSASSRSLIGCCCKDVCAMPDMAPCQHVTIRSCAIRRFISGHHHMRPAMPESASSVQRLRPETWPSLWLACGCRRRYCRRCCGRPAVGGLLRGRQPAGHSTTHLNIFAHEAMTAPCAAKLRDGLSCMLADKQTACPLHQSRAANLLHDSSVFGESMKRSQQGISHQPRLAGGGHDPRQASSDAP